MIRVIKKILLLIGKDLRIEARSRQTLGLVVMLGILIIVVLGFGLSGGDPMPAFAASAVLWVAYLFGGVLCFEKTMAVERHDGALAGLLAAPIDRGIIFAGKLITNLILMFVLAAVVTPVAIVLFHFDLSAAFGGFVIVMALGIFGFASLGTLFAAAASSSKLQGGLLSIMVFPLCLPVVVVSTLALIDMYGNGEPLSAGCLGTLIAFDVMYLMVSWLVFERILEP